MRIVVAGGGSAGHMAASHMRHHFPEADLVHAYDPRLPAIGVGEGTTPVFTEWAEKVLGWDMAYLTEHCDATPKQGIIFEGWGKAADTYSHYFHATEGTACHLSAERLIRHLSAKSSARIVPEGILEIRSVPPTASVLLANGQTLHADFVLDARGFPQELAERDVPLACVTTGAAWLLRGPVRAPMDRTRAVARPYGWIFVIPLQHDTAYGYVHTPSDRSLAKTDFRAFLAGEDVKPQTTPRWLPFPNFRRRTFFDGVVLSLGNRASFVEPLEATALGLIVLQLRLATFWLLDQKLGLGQANGVAAMNETLASTIDEVASFVGWHYEMGSNYHTPFWARSATAYAEWMQQRPETHSARFSAYKARGKAMPRHLAFVGSAAELNAPIASRDTFGGFLDLSFAKVGYGIGAF